MCVCRDGVQKKCMKESRTQTTSALAASLEKNKRLNAAEHRQCYRKIRTGLCLDPTESVHTDSERTFTLNLLNLSVLFLFNVAQRFTLVFTPETLNLDGLTQT